MFSFPKLKLTTLAVIAGLSFLQTGCPERQVGAALAGAALGAIMVDALTVREAPRPAPRPAPRYRPSYRDRNQRVCHVHQEWQRDSYGNVTYFETDSCNQATYRHMSTRNQQVTLNASDVSLAYNLKPEAADLLTSSLVTAANAQDDATARAAFAMIGLDLAAIKAMDANFQITPEMITGMSTALQQDPKDTATMLERLTQTVRAQEAARNQGESA